MERPVIIKTPPMDDAIIFGHRNKKSFLVVDEYHKLSGIQEIPVTLMHECVLKILDTIRFRDHPDYPLVIIIESNEPVEDLRDNNAKWTLACVESSLPTDKAFGTKMWWGTFRCSIQKVNSSMVPFVTAFDGIQLWFRVVETDEEIEMQLIMAHLCFMKQPYWMYWEQEREFDYDQVESFYSQNEGRQNYGCYVGGKDHSYWIDSVVSRLYANKGFSFDGKTYQIKMGEMVDG